MCSSREITAQETSSAGRAGGLADLRALLSYRPPGCHGTSKGFRGCTKAHLVLPCGEVRCKDFTTANSSRSSSFSPVNAKRLGGSQRDQRDFKLRHEAH